MRDPILACYFFGVELHLFVERTAQAELQVALDGAPQSQRVDDQPTIVRADQLLHSRRGRLRDLRQLQRLPRQLIDRDCNMQYRAR